MTDNHETLWAREGDVAQSGPGWSPFASCKPAEWRSKARVALHGFDFRVESHNGTKQTVKVKGGADG